MNRPHEAMLPACLALLAAVSPSAALAAERGCPALTIEADASFRERFPELLARLRAELAGRSDLDACARVELSVQDSAVIGVSVTLPDGRAASRNMTRQDDVLPTLQALLLVPEHAPAAPEAVVPATPPRVEHPTTLAR
ncbi:MAG TPA: hypothetical protein VEQ58_13830, partial [Polyangiaceae bacterium]|nr:hypothetical protein [Polyangiaceae bacterium]